MTEPSLPGQLDLFATGPRHNLPSHPCTPATPGTGPEGTTCRSCRHKARVDYHTRHYLKCALMKPHWTHGPGSDIRARWPACSFYQPAEHQS